MRAWFVALAAAIWVTVVTASILLFTSIGYCLLVSDPYLRNRFVCSTVGTTTSFDIITMMIGIPVLILIDHMARNPSWLGKSLILKKVTEKDKDSGESDAQFKN